MFARLSQLSRHLSRTYPTYTHTSTFAPSSSLLPNIMSDRASVPPSERFRRTIHTAGCIIIGDEVLGGKTVDSNSAYFAKWCFSLGINLKKVVVIPDDEGDIVENVKRFSDEYDFVVTSGGIGPTHDDITYQSIARAFSLPLTEHTPSFERMKSLSKPHKSQPNFRWDVPSAALEAKKRMIILPLDSSRPDDEQVLFVADDLWVPVSVVNGNIHILPGVPRLFEKMIDGLKPRVLPLITDPEGKGTHRILFSTPLAESEVAGYLTELAQKAEPKGVKVGSYPRFGKSRNTVTLVGRDVEYMESLVKEVEEGCQGYRIQKEGEDDEEGSDKDT